VSVFGLRAERERFADRRHAGRLLADLVAAEVEDSNVVVLALPRGGVPVAHEVASRLRAPLDVLLVRKLGVPWQPELAFGAVATGGVVVLNDDYLEALGIGPDTVREVTELERSELERSERAYRDEHAALVELSGKTAVVVDDGIATGATMKAALASLQERGVLRRVVATPVAAPEAIRELADVADAVLVLRAPPNFAAVGAWYEDFSPVSDGDVRALLASAARQVGQEG
jgi:predicted phosphoribosyltransferase